MSNERVETSMSEPGPAPVKPPIARRNPLRDRAAWQAARAAAEHDPGAYHGAIARRELHWFDPALGTAGAWIT